VATELALREGTALRACDKLEAQLAHMNGHFQRDVRRAVAEARDLWRSHARGGRHGSQVDGSTARGGASSAGGVGGRPGSRGSTGTESLFSRPLSRGSQASGMTLFSAISEGLPPVVQEFRRKWQKLTRTGSYTP